MSERDPEVGLRAALVDDLDWVVEQHGLIYGREYGYDDSFVCMVQIVADEYLKLPPGSGHRGWIAVAPVDDDVEQRLGSVFLIEHEAGVGQLRLLVLDAAARGRGIGRLLVSTCVVAARRHGYRSLVLETERELAAARHLYRSHGFRLTRQMEHADWGRDDLVSEWWRLDFD